LQCRRSSRTMQSALLLLFKHFTHAIFTLFNAYQPQSSPALNMLMAFIPYDDLRLDAYAESICSKGATTLTQSTNCISLSQSRRWASWRCSLRAGGHIQKKTKQNKWAINHLTKLQCRVDEEQAKIRLFKQEANSPDFLIENSTTKVFNPLRCAHEYRRFVHHHEPNGGFPEVSECVLEVIVRQRYLELLA
jgi:hypothetical protein